MPRRYTKLKKYSILFYALSLVVLAFITVILFRSKITNRNFIINFILKFRSFLPQLYACLFIFLTIGFTIAVIGIRKMKIVYTQYYATGGKKPFIILALVPVAVLGILALFLFLV